MTWVEDVRIQADQPDSSEGLDWIRAHWLILAGLLLIVVQLALKGAALAHGYFRQDDFQFFDRALASHLDWRYLMTVYGGHLMPGGLIVTWMLARISLYDWALTSTITLVFLAASSVALLRLLRTMFGSRPAILIPLGIYLFTPLMLTGLSFWTTTLQWLPPQLVIFMALNAHINYLRSGRFWHAIVAAAWFAVGMLFDDMGVLVVLLLFALTSAFFASGRWTSAALEVLRRYSKAWTLYGALTLAYVVVFLLQLHTSDQQPTKPGQFANVLSFISTLVRVSFIPGSLGGPWRWLSVGDIAFAAELPALMYLAWVVGAVIVGSSLWYRSRAWRAWVILAGWIFLTAIAPLVIGRVGLSSPTTLGTDLHHLADSLPVLAICLGLAFWPVVGEEAVYSGHPPLRLRQIATAAVLTVFGAGSLWSFHSYEAVTTSAPERSYIATARAAVAGAPQGAVIYDTSTPPDIEIAVLFGSYAYTSQVIGPLAGELPGKHLRWTSAPSGVIADLMVFDNNGRLTHAAIIGRANTPSPARATSPTLGQANSRSHGKKSSRSRAGQGCWTAGAAAVRMPIPGLTPMFYWPWTIDLSYHGPAATLAVEFGGRWHDVQLLAGSHDVYVPALGAGSSIQAQVISGGPSVCITRLKIGNIEPSYSPFPIPAYPVPG